MKRAIFKAACLVTILASPAVAQQSTSGVWEFHNNPDHSGPVRLTLACSTDGSGSVRWSDGESYPSRCATSGQTTTVRAWGAPSAMQRGEAPAIIYRISFDGNKVNAIPVDPQTGRSLPPTVGKKRGTRGRTAAQLASSANRNAASTSSAAPSGPSCRPVWQGLKDCRDEGLRGEALTTCYRQVQGAYDKCSGTGMYGKPSEGPASRVTRE